MQRELTIGDLSAQFEMLGRHVHAWQEQYASIVEQLHHQLMRQSQQLDYFASRLALLPQPERATWQRTAGPDLSLCEKATEVMPAAIVRVTIDDAHPQIVRAYNSNGRILRQGPFRALGQELLKMTGSRLRWEHVKTPIPESPSFSSSH